MTPAPAGSVFGPEISRLLADSSVVLPPEERASSRCRMWRLFAPPAAPTKPSSPPPSPNPPPPTIARPGGARWPPTPGPATPTPTNAPGGATAPATSLSSPTSREAPASGATGSAGSSAVAAGLPR
jgi:hypothetical protein